VIRPEVAALLDRLNDDTVSLAKYAEMQAEHAASALWDSDFEGAADELDSLLDTLANLVREIEAGL